MYIAVGTFSFLHVLMIPFSLSISLLLLSLLFYEGRFPVVIFNVIGLPGHQLKLKSLKK